MSPEKKINQIERERIFAGPVEAVCDPRMIAHCRDPYCDHPHGCPNWGCKEGCPPNIRYFPMEYSTKVYIAAIKFNFAEYLASRREAHPDWTEKAIRNLRHWQGHVRSERDRFLFEYLSTHPEIDGEIVTSPEGQGVNVFATCEKVGIHLERYPQNYVHNVVLIANRLNEGQA